MRSIRGVIATAAALLLGASVHAGSLFVPNWNADASHGRVTEFDATTGQFKRHTVGPLAADIVTGLTFGPDRKLYVSVLDTVNR